MTCLKSTTPPKSANKPSLPSETPDLSSVPPIYHDLAEVFQKYTALSLPPDWPYDCAIDLFPGAQLPTD